MERIGRGDRLVVEGVVGGAIERPLGRVQIDVANSTKTTARGDDFPLATEDGELVIRVTTDTVLLPERRLRGNFGELVDDMMAEWVLDHAPGDHMHCELRGNVLQRGDQVTCQGKVAGIEQVGTNYREAATVEVKDVEAEVVAIGEDGASLIAAWQARQEALAAKQNLEHQSKSQAARAKPVSKPKTRRPPSSLLSLRPVWILGACSILALGFSALGALPQGAAGRGTWTTLLVGLCFAETGIYAWRRRRWMPAFHQVGRSKRGTKRRWQVARAFLTYFLCLIPVVLLALLQPQIGFFASMPLGLPLLGILLTSDQRDANRALALLRATPLSEEMPDKRYGSIEGSFTGSLHYQRNHEQRIKTTARTATDHEGRLYDASTSVFTIHWKEQTRGKRAALQTANGVIELDLQDATWAASSYQLTYPAEIHPSFASAMQQLPTKEMRERFQRDEGRTRPILENGADDGAQVLVAARIRHAEGGPQIRSTGPDSFLLFSAPAGASARKVLRGELGWHYLGVCALLLALGIKLYLALHLPMI